MVGAGGSSRSSTLSLSLLSSMLCMVQMMSFLMVGCHGGRPIRHASEKGICESVAIRLGGYKCEEFEVKTDDGFILKLLRIPQRDDGGGQANTNTSSRPPVLLQHGVLMDGVTWLLNSPQESLPLMLADIGYDVWIPNDRGTKFSRRHVQFDPAKPEFWNWSWDDIVMHDIPAVYDFIFQQTGQKFHFVGHSMGTLTAMAAFSERKQLDKIKSVTLLCPIAYLSHMKTAIGSVAAKSFVGEMDLTFGLDEFDPKGKAVSDLLKVWCADPKVDCYDMMTAFTGKNCCLNESTVELFLANEPQPTSTKTLVHMAQTVRDGILRKYDFGTPKANTKHYGQTEPPRYNLSNIPQDLPMLLSYGGQDALSDTKDVQTLLDALKLHDEAKLHVQYVKDYAHADFVLAKTSKEIVYNQILQFISTNN